MRVLWTLAARQDRTDIVDYIAIENPRAALGMDELFSEAATRLGDFPPDRQTRPDPRHARIAPTSKLSAGL